MTKEQFLNNLKDLVISFFGADEFRRFIRFGPNGIKLEKMLPGVTASYVNIASDGVKILFENDVIDDQFFDRLIDERPRREMEVNKLRNDFYKVT